MEWVKDKSHFKTINDYSVFCEAYLSFIFDGLQAVIVSQNENHYHFFNIKKKEITMSLALLIANL